VISILGCEGDYLISVNRLTLLAVACLFAALPLCAFNDNKGLVDEVIRMSRAGVAEDAIIAYVVHTSGRFDVTADDIIAMRDANVPPRVIRVMIEESRVRTPDTGYEHASVRDHDPTPPWTQIYDPWWYMPRYYTPLPRNH